LEKKGRPYLQGREGPRMGLSKFNKKGAGEEGGGKSERGKLFSIGREAIWKLREP